MELKNLIKELQKNLIAKEKNENEFTFEFLLENYLCKDLFLEIIVVHDKDTNKFEIIGKWDNLRYSNDQLRNDIYTRPEKETTRPVTENSREYYFDKNDYDIDQYDYDLEKEAEFETWREDDEYYTESENYFFADTKQELVKLLQKYVGTHNNTIKDILSSK